MLKRLTNAFLFTNLIVLSFFSHGCDEFHFSTSQSQKRLAQRPLRVAVLNHPLVHSNSAYQDKTSKVPTGVAIGIDHDLLLNFAKTNGLSLQWVWVNSTEEAIKKLRQNEVDLTATRSPELIKFRGVRLGPALEETELSLFCPRQMGLQNDKSLKSETLLIAKKDNHFQFESEALSRYPKANVVVVDSSVRELFTRMNAHKKTCVIAETLEGLAIIQSLPRLTWVDHVSKPFAIHWRLRAQDKDLALLLQSWYQRASRADEIATVHDRYLIQYTILKPVDVVQFYRNKKNRLPQWRSDFEEAGKLNQLPWTLIAAIAYQESHWDEHARSYTGVRGLMQLTEETATHMGVTDRKDPHQSIFGGARYFRYLLNMTSDTLSMEERVSMTLTAYNLGWGHLMDAQNLAAKKGLNPSSWRHLYSVLPLLANPTYASQLQYGQARGHEAQDFVERVKAFEQLLRRADAR